MTYTDTRTGYEYVTAECVHCGAATVIGDYTMDGCACDSAPFLRVAHARRVAQAADLAYDVAYRASQEYPTAGAFALARTRLSEAQRTMRQYLTLQAAAR